MAKQLRCYDFWMTRDVLLRRSQCYYALAKHLHTLKRTEWARRYERKGFADYKLAEHIEKTNRGKGCRRGITMKAGTVSA